MVQTQAIADKEIVRAVDHGLSKEVKTLPSWIFYDVEGDKIFQEIMRIPEYYPTRCEYEIIQHHKEDLHRYFGGDRQPFQLIELGAGDGIKTEILLKYFFHHGLKFTYRPVDISSTVLDHLMFRLHKNIPGLAVEPIHKRYSHALDDLDKNEKKVLLFLGANIGNFSFQEALRFLSDIILQLTQKDFIFIGFDLKKDPRIISRAYDDKGGITKEFNLNILKRINREIGAQFVIGQFDHYASYDAETGTARSFLVSLKDQDVYIEALQKTFHFSQWETIHTEISQKYDLVMMENLLSEAGLEIVDLFFDSNHYFCDVLLKKF